MKCKWSNIPIKGRLSEWREKKKQDPSKCCQCTFTYKYKVTSHQKVKGWKRTYRVNSSQHLKAGGAILNQSKCISEQRSAREKKAIS